MSMIVRRRLGRRTGIGTRMARTIVNVRHQMHDWDIVSIPSRAPVPRRAGTADAWPRTARSGRATSLVLAHKYAMWIASVGWGLQNLVRLPGRTGMWITGDGWERD